MDWRRIAAALIVVAMLLIALNTVTAQENPPVRIIFMHHSTGGNLMWQGGVREALTELGYELWDHGYNDEGLSGPDGERLDENWDVPGDNTDPDGWYAIFNQPVTDPPANTFSHMLAYDVIIFKSCFPTSDIQDDAQWQAYQDYYLSIRDVIDQHPDKLFIAFTTPPLLPGQTTADNAARAQRWAEYLTSAEYLDGHSNLVVFDIFNLLADEDNYLRAAYRTSEDDSHPNEIANQTLGPLLVELTDTSIQAFVPGAVVAKPEPTATAVITPSQGEANGLIIDDFERAELGEDWSEAADEGAEITCALAAPGLESAQALKLAFKTIAQRYAQCSHALTASPDWQESSGFHFDWRSDTPGLTIIVYAWIEGSPFEVQPPLAPPTEAWTTVEIPWEQVQKASWASETDLDKFDPTRVESISFNVGDWEKGVVGTIWIDNWQLLPPE